MAGDINNSQIICVGVDLFHFVIVKATKFLSYTRERFLHELDNVWRFGEIARGTILDQSWTFFRSRSWFPRARVRVNIYVPHLRLFLLESIVTSFRELNESKVEQLAVIPRAFEMSSNSAVIGDRWRVTETTFRAGLDFATTRSSSPPPCFPSCICLSDMARRSLIWLKCSLCGTNTEDDSIHHE